MNKLLSLLAMASEWMANGNINQFIKVNENVDRFELVRYNSYFRLGSKLINPLTAQRRRQRVDLPARPGDDPR